MGPTVKALRRYFRAQRDRIVNLLPDLFGHQLSERSVQEVLKRIYCVSPAYDRLYPDGTAVTMKIADGRGCLSNQFVTVVGCCGMNGEQQVVKVRALDSEREDDLDNWLKAADELAAVMQAKLSSGLSTGGNFQLETLGLPGRFDVRNHEAEKWLAGKQHDYWLETVEATTKSLLSERLAEVMADAPTMEKLILAVNDVMGGRITSSSETIARTEISGAYNAGQDITRHLVGVTGKEWVATQDARTRSAHYEADGQERDQGLAFDVGGEPLMYPGDPDGSVENIVNCRCVATAVPGDNDVLVPPADADE